MDKQPDEKEISDYLKRFLPRSESSFEERMPGITEIMDYLKGFEGGDRAVKSLLDLCRTFEFFGNLQNAQLDALGVIMKKCRDMREKYDRPGQKELVFTLPELTSLMSFLSNVVTENDKATSLFYYSHYVYLLISDTLMDFVTETKIDLDGDERTGELDSSKSILQKFEEKHTWLNNTILSLPDRNSAEGRDFYLREFIYTMNIDIDMPVTGNGPFVSLGPHCRKRVSPIVEASERRERGEQLDLPSRLLLSTSDVINAEFVRSAQIIEEVSRVTEEIEREDRGKGIDDQVSFKEFVTRFLNSGRSSPLHPKKEEEASSNNKNTPMNQKRHDKSGSKLPSRPHTAPKTPNVAEKPSMIFNATIGILDNANEIQQMAICLMDAGVKYPLAGDVFGHAVVVVLIISAAACVLFHPHGLVQLNKNINQAGITRNLGFQFLASASTAIKEGMVIIDKKAINQKKKALEDELKEHKKYINAGAGDPREDGQKLKILQDRLSVYGEHSKSISSFYEVGGKIISDITPKADGKQDSKSIWESRGTMALTGMSFVTNILGEGVVSVFNTLGGAAHLEPYALYAHVNTINLIIREWSKMIPSVNLDPIKHWTGLYAVAVEKFSKAKGVFGAGKEIAKRAQGFHEFIKLFKVKEFRDMMRDASRAPEFRQIVSDTLKRPISMLFGVICHPSYITDPFNQLSQSFGGGTEAILVAASKFLNAMRLWDQSSLDTLVHQISSQILGSQFFYDFVSSQGMLYPFVGATSTFAVICIVIEILYWNLACKTTLHPSNQNSFTRNLIWIDGILWSLGFPVSFTNALTESANSVVDSTLFELIRSLILESDSYVRNRSSLSKIFLLFTKFFVGIAQKVFYVCLFSSVGGYLLQRTITAGMLSYMPSTILDLLPVGIALITNPADLINTAHSMLFAFKVFRTFGKGTNETAFIDDFFKNVLSNGAAAKTFLDEALTTDAWVSVFMSFTSFCTYFGPFAKRGYFGDKVYLFEKSSSHKITLAEKLKSFLFTPYLGVNKRIEIPHPEYEVDSKNDAPSLSALTSDADFSSKDNKDKLAPTEMLWEIMLQRARPGIRVIGMIAKLVDNGKVCSFVRTYDNHGSAQQTIDEEKRRVDFEDAFCQLVSTAHKGSQFKVLWGTKVIPELGFTMEVIKGNMMTELPCLADHKRNPKIMLFGAKVKVGKVKALERNPLVNTLLPIKTTNDDMILAYSLEF